MSNKDPGGIKPPGVFLCPFFRHLGKSTGAEWSWICCFCCRLPSSPSVSVGDPSLRKRGAKDTTDSRLRPSGMTRERVVGFPRYIRGCRPQGRFRGARHYQKSVGYTNRHLAYRVAARKAVLEECNNTKRECGQIIAAWRIE